MTSNRSLVHAAMWPVGLLALFGLACGVGGGATFGENGPGNAAYGGGTYLDDARLGATKGVGENGSLAVDPDTELVYTLQIRQFEDQIEKRVVVAGIDGDSTVIFDASNYVDVRVLFPPDAVLLMAEPAWSEAAVEDGRCRQPEEIEREQNRCGDELIWFSKDGRSELKRIPTKYRFHGTRLSPKRNYLLVADNFYNNAPIHLLDLNNGATHIVPQDGAWFEGMWAHEEETLFTAHFNTGRASGEAFLTIREWFPGEGTRAALGQSLCFYREGEPLPEGCDSYAIRDVDPMFFAGFSWIVVSPDDRYVAVPAQRGDGTAIVVVVDRTTRQLRVVDDAYGPVGFTPDSATMVAFGWETPPEPASTLGDPGQPSDGAYLLFVELETFAESIEPTPHLNTPSFFVSHDTSDVVVVDVGGSSGMMIIDLETRRTTRMAGTTQAAAARENYQPLDFEQREHTLDRRVLSANDLRTERQLRTPEGQCHEAVCATGQGEAFALLEFASRTGHAELWLIEHGRLFRLDLEHGFVEHVELDDGTPKHINILPRQDRLVLDSEGEQTLRFFDPVRLRVESETSIALGWRATGD